jgi:hypothetical protein
MLTFEQHFRGQTYIIKQLLKAKKRVFKKQNESIIVDAVLDGYKTGN